MQLKRYQNEIKEVLVNDGVDALAFKISEIKNERMKSDYVRLGLSEDKNIYHYITRDKGRFVINECAYPLIDYSKLQNFNLSSTALSWSDGKKDYKYTFADSQIHQKFDPSKKDTLLLYQFDIKIIEDPFSFLLESYFSFIDKAKSSTADIVEAYLPLYSFETKEVEKKSGLNAWNGAPKVKGSNYPRPLNEVYNPITKAFHQKFPNFFNNNILKVIEEREVYKYDKERRPEIKFHIQLPNGKKIPGLITGDNMKNFQSGSSTELDENGKRFGQSALGQWLLVDVLGLKERQPVTREWLIKKGTDSVRLWREKDDYTTINIDFAPIGSFEAFMKDEPIPQDDEYLETL